MFSKKKNAIQIQISNASGESEQSPFSPLNVLLKLSFFYFYFMFMLNIRDTSNVYFRLESRLHLLEKSKHTSISCKKFSMWKRVREFLRSSDFYVTSINCHYQINFILMNLQSKLD